MFGTRQIIYLLCAVFSLTSVVQLSAQKTQEEQQVTIVFTGFSWEAAIDKIYYRNGTEDVPCFFPNGSRSAEFEYRGPETLTFYRMKQTAEGYQRIPVAATKIPKTRANYLLLFAPGSEGTSAEYRIMLIDDDPKKYEGGTMRIINLTQESYACKVDTKKDVLKPTSEYFVKPRVESGESFNLLMAKEVRGKVRPIFNSDFRYDENLRTLIFLYPKNTPEGFSMKILNDTPPKSAAPEQETGEPGKTPPSTT